MVGQSSVSRVDDDGPEFPPLPLPKARGGAFPAGFEGS